MTPASSRGLSYSSTAAGRRSDRSATSYDYRKHQFQTQAAQIEERAFRFTKIWIAFLPLRTWADGPTNLMATKLLTATKLPMASKICSTIAARGNELARLVQCPLYSLL